MSSKVLIIYWKLIQFSRTDLYFEAMSLKLYEVFLLIIMHV